MALEIRSIPVLTGETAERFVREAEENERNPQRKYNPQNEMLPFHKTKCSETQNEASSL